MGSSSSPKYRAIEPVFTVENGYSDVPAAVVYEDQNGWTILSRAGYWKGAVVLNRMDAILRASSILQEPIAYRDDILIAKFIQGQATEDEWAIAVLTQL